MPILPWRLSPWLSFFPLRPHTIDCALTEVRNQLFSQPTLGIYNPPPQGEEFLFFSDTSSLGQMKPEVFVTLRSFHFTRAKCVSSITLKKDVEGPT